MTTLLRSALLAALAVAAAACADPAAAPSATITRAAPDRLIASDDARDDLVITVAYRDGDGDLGGGVARVHDCRADGVVTELPIPAIAPEGVIGHPIEGTLELHVSDVGAIAAGAPPAACRELGVAAAAAGAAIFCVILTDAAGQSGEGDCTDPITVTE